MRKDLKKILLPWLDWNDNKKIDWWEYLIPIGFVLLVEFIAEVGATFLYNWMFK